MRRDPIFDRTIGATRLVGQPGPPPVAAGGALTDGDKGDIEVSDAGATWQIGAGAVSTLELGGDITAAGKALLDDASASAQRATLGLGSAALEAAGFFAEASHGHAMSDITGLLAALDAKQAAATGTPNGSKFLRDDNSWQTPVAVVADGDKGDVTVSGSGTIWTVDPALFPFVPVSAWDYAGGVNLTDAGADPGDVANALETGMQAAVDQGREYSFHDVLHPVADKFRVNRQLVVVGDLIRIAGHGGGSHAIGTRIEWQTGSASWGLRLQSAAAPTGNGSSSSGYCRNLTLTKAGTYTNDGSIGFQLRSLRQFVVDSVTSIGFDIGFDMIDNCFGSEWRNCRTPEGTCMVGMNIRTGPQSGNDIPFYNCWFAGKVAAVHVSGGAGNFRFYSGQFLSGNGYTTDQDDKGTITIGKDYLTGTTGNCGIVAIQGDFEVCKRMWWIRTYGTVQLHLYDSTLLATEAAQPMIGFSKMEGLNDSKILYENNEIRGTFSSATLVSESGANSGFGITEWNWKSTTPTTINSVGQSAGWFQSTRHYLGSGTRGFSLEHSGSKTQLRLNGSTILTDLVAGLDATTGLVEQTGAAAFAKRALGVGAGTSVLTRADGDARFQAKATGTPDGTKFLRDDGAWATPPGGGQAFPVGSVFIAVVSTNPATLLGYGTWSAFATGRMLIGLDSGDTDFDTVEETGGAKTHTLSTGQLPSHTHPITDPGHTHLTQRYPTATGGSSGFTADTSMSGTLADNTLPTKSATTGIAATDATGSGSAVNHMPPYIAVYMWKRTA